MLPNLWKRRSPLPAGGAESSPHHDAKFVQPTELKKAKRKTQASSCHLMLWWRSEISRLFASVPQLDCPIDGTVFSIVNLDAVNTLLVLAVTVHFVQPWMERIANAWDTMGLIITFINMRRLSCRVCARGLCTSANSTLLCPKFTPTTPRSGFSPYSSMWVDPTYPDRARYAKAR